MAVPLVVALFAQAEEVVEPPVPGVLVEVVDVELGHLALPPTAVGAGVGLLIVLIPVLLSMLFSEVHRPSSQGTGLFQQEPGVVKVYGPSLRSVHSFPRADYSDPSTSMYHASVPTKELPPIISAVVPVPPLSKSTPRNPGGTSPGAIFDSG